jgi:hypothetical protein
MPKRPQLSYWDFVPPANAVKAAISAGKAYKGAVDSWYRNQVSTRPDRLENRNSLAGRTAYKGGAPKKKSAAGKKR